MNDQVVRAFKKTICAEMGKSNSSLFARQVLPIAWEMAEAMGWDAKEFCLKVGFSDHLLAEKGYITLEEDVW